MHTQDNELKRKLNELNRNVKTLIDQYRQTSGWKRAKKSNMATENILAENKKTITVQENQSARDNKRK